MKITATTGTGANQVVTVLGDDNGTPVKARISNWLPSRSMIEQIVPRPRADYQTLYDRKNRLHTMTFNVSRSLASYGDALAFIRDHIIAVPNQATVEVSQLDGAGGPGLTFVDALIKEMKVVEHRGAWCLFAFQIIGAQMKISVHTP